LLCDFRAFPSFGFFHYQYGWQDGKTAILKISERCFSFHQYNRGGASFCPLFQKFFLSTSTTPAAALFARFLQTFFFHHYNGGQGKFFQSGALFFNFFFQPNYCNAKIGAKKAANLFQDLLLVCRSDGRRLFSFFRERETTF